MLARLFRKSVFRVKRHYVARAFCVARTLYWRMQGMVVGREVRLSSLKVTWPHKVRIGDRCSLEHGVYFNFTGPYTEGIGIELGSGCFVGTGCEFNISSHIALGESCLIASGTRFIDHNHGMRLGSPMKHQPETQADIMLGRDVWVGANAVVLAGVTIGDGAVVGAGAVVTRPVAANMVVAGSPARPIGQRVSRSSPERVFEGEGELGLLVAVLGEGRSGDGEALAPFQP